MFARKFIPLSLVLVSFNSFAIEKNMMVRMRMLSVMPDEAGKPSVVGGKVKLTDSAVPEVDFTYFFSENFAAELVLATSPHKATVRNSSAGTLDLGDVNLLPPTLLAQYHKEMGNWKPYVGAGLNYTIFTPMGAGGMDHVKYKNSVGYAWQVGADYKIAENTYINFDLKKLYLSTDVKVKTGTTKVTADVDINPWIAGLGLGYRF